MAERTLEDLEKFVAEQLEHYTARAVAELADADPYLAGHLAGNINALATIRTWLQWVPPVEPGDTASVEPGELTNAQRRANIAARVARRGPRGTGWS